MASIIYCGLFSKQGIVLAESTLSKSYSVRIINLLNSMFKKEKSKEVDFIEIENGDMVTYCKAKSIVFVCVSKFDDGEDKPTIFLSRDFIPGILNAFDKDLNKLIKPTTGEALVSSIYQSKLEKILNTAIKNTDTGIKTSSKIKGLLNNLDGLKKDLKANIDHALVGTENLNDLLIQSEQINQKAVEYQQNAEILEQETRFFKPWMIITGISILVVFLAYTVIALWRCGNMNVFCPHQSLKEDFTKYVSYVNKKVSNT